MGARSAIQWTDRTWNPWHGCQHVSAGCDHCYMFSEKRRYGDDPEKVVRSKTTFHAPLKWERELAASGKRALVFTCSWSDFFIRDADSWRPAAWDIIRRTPHLTYQVLTKRPARIERCLPPDWGPTGYPNVWLGVSVEDQATAEARIPLLVETPAVVRFVSNEPQLGRVDLTRLELRKPAHPFDPHLSLNALTGHIAGPDDMTDMRVQWVIVGGESGSGARPFSLEHARSLVQQCRDAGVAVFVKQLGKWPSVARSDALTRDPNYRLPLLHAKGGDPAEWPEDLRVREFPEGRAL